MRLRKVTITPEVREVLGRATVEGSDRPVVKLNQPGLERKLYEATDKVLRALGGKWDRKAQGHVFSRPVEGELAEALTSGVAVDQAKTHEQFFTPADLARDLVSRLPDDALGHVLEPSAGTGRIVEALLARGVQHLTVVEKDEAVFREVAALVPVHGNGLFNEDFMEWEPVGKLPIDGVVMNPPFSGGQDTDHVRRAFGFLRPGGTLIAIMGTHWTFAGDRKACAFRDWLTSLMPSTTHSWADLPVGSFTESGTGVATGVLTMHKGN